MNKKINKHVVTARLLITKKLSDINFTRALEHMGISNLAGNCIKNTKESAISDHRLQRASPLTFDDFDVLEYDSSKFKLLIKESLLIT